MVSTAGPSTAHKLYPRQNFTKYNPTVQQNNNRIVQQTRTHNPLKTLTYLALSASCLSLGQTQASVDSLTWASGLTGVTGPGESDLAEPSGSRTGLVGELPRLAGAKEGAGADSRRRDAASGGAAPRYEGGLWGFMPAPSSVSRLKQD